MLNVEKWDSKKSEMAFRNQSPCRRSDS